MKVANKKCVRRLALRNMKSAKTRNIIAVIAIILTTVLFTSLFTIALSVIDGFQEANFRQIGTYTHGDFERLTEEQLNELKDDEAFKELGVRMLLGTAEDAPFNKISVEVSYVDETCAKFLYLTPEEGALPSEGTNKAAADTTILKLLGIEPEIGKEFELTFNVNNNPVTKTFILSGYWEPDELAPANHVLLPKSMVEEICRDFPVDKSLGQFAGLYDLYYMLNNSIDIEEKAEKILNRHGYQSTDMKLDNYIGCGINWGYVSSFSSSDMETVILIGAVLLIIIFTGYLVINNIFRIAIANDIRRYGMLKTIGTTKKQIRKMVYMEALSLSLIAIPIGLIIGYGVGNILTPVVLEELNDIVIMVSVNPLIFIFAAMFSLITVFISSLRPAKLASRTTPIEALRFTERKMFSGTKSRKIGGTAAKTKTGKSKRFFLLHMAVSNVLRSKAKTIVTMISLMLAVVLLSITFSLADSFNLDEYLKDVKADFMIAHANYFQANGHIFSEDRCITEEDIKDIDDTGMVTKSGAVYACGAANQIVYQYVPNDVYADELSYYMSDEDVEYSLENDSQIDGRYEDNVDLLGMDDFCLDQLNCVEGDLNKLYEEGNYIAAVYLDDGYGNIDAASHWAEVGEHVTIRYVEEFEYYNPYTGYIYTDEEVDNLGEDEACSRRSVTYHDVDYEVCAIVIIPDKLGYRYFLFNQYVVSSNNLKANLPNANIMYYAFDVAEENIDDMEKFISDYTEKVMTDYGYESKQTWTDELSSYKKMFIILGSVLSFVIGLIGVLNFLNVNLTNMIVRKQEFAMLQSIGMTGRQLLQMLVTEGLIYALGSILFAIFILISTSHFIKNQVEKMFWFSIYEIALKPILFVLPLFILLGIIIPMVMYHIVAEKSIVERLREVE